MKKMLALIAVLAAPFALAAGTPSHRVMQIDNNQVKAWITTIHAGANKGLTMHRHDHDRVVVAFDNVSLKVVNDKGQSHTMVWKKNKPYYLSKDVANEMHTDENMSGHAVKVLVIELASA